jgi:hypothetical protein
MNVGGSQLSPLIGVRIYVYPDQTFSGRTVGIHRKNSFREERSSGDYSALQSIHVV